MDADDQAEELAFAIDLAEQAGRIHMRSYERLEQIDYKSARDVVTEADHRSEELIIAAIRARHPDDAILAEESGAHRSHGGAGVEPAAGRGRLWCIDPLDGTINYANGVPYFCCSIGLVIEGVATVGVVHDPVRSETYAATLAGAATLNGREVRASTKERLEDALVSLAVSGRAAASRDRAVRRKIRAARSMGASALALAYLAGGRFDVFIQTGGLSTWDIAAAGLIAERAGARVTDVSGGPWLRLDRSTREHGVVAAPPQLHRSILELVRPPG